MKLLKQFFRKLRLSLRPLVLLLVLGIVGSYLTAPMWIMQVV